MQRDTDSTPDPGSDTDTKHLDELLEPGTVLMVGTGTAVTESRPLTVARVDRRRIEILVDSREPWAAALPDGAPVIATLSDNRSNTWATFHGTGTLSREQALIDDLWSPFASAYFDDGRETPGIAVFTIGVDDGRWWSAPAGRVGNLVSVVKAAVGGADRGGDHGDVDLRA